MKAGDEVFLKNVKENHQNKDYHYRKKQKIDEFDIACYSENVSSSNENALLTTYTTNNDETDNSIISNTEILFEKRDTDSLKKREIFDNNTMEKTQTYDKHCLGAKIEEKIYKNGERTRDDKIVKPGSCRTSDFINANPMDPEKILKNERKCKYFIELFQEQFNILFDFLGEAKYAFNYWNASSQRKNKCTLGNKIPLAEKDQMFMTLLRLRRGFNLYTLTHFYSVSESYIRKMFTTWMFLYHHLKT